MLAYFRSFLTSPSRTVTLIASRCSKKANTYRLLVYMHEVPDLGSKAGGIRRLDRYDQLAEYVFGE